MNVKVNIINTRCILVSGAVTLPSVTVMTSIVSEESLARDRYTDRPTHRRGLVYVNSLLKSQDYYIDGLIKY